MSEAPASLRAVCGRGGSGKTRLAFRLLERLKEQRPHTWQAGFLEPQRADDVLRNAAFLRWSGHRETLVVIDDASSYADQLARNIVPELLSYGGGLADAPRLRFLLLERGADPRQGWYEQVRGAAQDCADDLFPQAPIFLPALEDSQRLELFQSILRVLDQRKGMDSGSLVSDASLPARLGVEKMWDPLVIAMAALVSHERRNLGALDLNRQDLVRIVAEHETDRIRKSVGTAEKARMPLHMAAYVTLTGALRSDELFGACEEEIAALREESNWTPGGLVERVCALLPAEESGVQVGPIKPNVVGEAFFTAVLSQTAQRGAETVRRAWTRKAGTVTSALVRAIQDLSVEVPGSSKEAANDQDWLLHRLGELLRTEDVGALTPAGFWAIHEAIPLNTILMAKVARDFYRAVFELREADLDPAWARASLAALIAWGNHESGLGNRQRALQIGEVAAGRYRGQTEGDRKAFLPGLAMSLNNLSVLQSKMGKRPDALASIAEAVQYYRELANGNREAFLPDLASSLNNLSIWQSEMGQRPDALASIVEAVGYYRELANGNREAFLPDLASSLNNLSVRQSEMGQRPDALASIAEAVQSYRELANGNRDAFLPDLAISLNNLSLRQSEMGRRPDALASITEAVLYFRELVNGNRDAFLPDLAMSLNNLSNRQSEMRQRPDALASIAEAVQSYRELANGNRDAFLPDLAMSLNNLSNRQSEMRQRPDALASIAEAVQIHRELADGNRDAFLPALAMSLNNLSGCQSEMGQRPDALSSIAEAVQIRRELADGNRDAFLPDLAMSLNNLSNRQSEMGQRPDALASISEAVLYYRELANGNRDAFLPALAMSLNNLSNRQSEMGQRPDALASIAEAVQSYRELANGNRDAFLPDLARSLGMYGQILLDSDPQKASDMAAEGVRLLTSLARELPHAHLGMASALAQVYARAQGALGNEPDPEITWPLEVERDGTVGA